MATIFWLSICGVTLAPPDHVKTREQQLLKLATVATIDVRRKLGAVLLFAGWGSGDLI